MTKNRREDFTWIMLACAILFTLPATRLARGQDDWDAEDRAATQSAGRENIRLVEQNIDQWIFGVQNIAMAKERINSTLMLRLGAIERAGGLSKAQIEKLRLAGHCDMARFFHKADALKEECKGININGPGFQNQWMKIQPLRMEFNSGLFGEKSMFQKVLDGIALSDPSNPYHVQERERRKFQHRAAIELAVGMFELGVPLTKVQREKFLKVLCDELEPPKKFGEMNQYVIFYQASNLDENKLKPIFDDAQWRALNNAFRQAKLMVPNLRARGVIQ